MEARFARDDGRVGELISDIPAKAEIQAARFSFFWAWSSSSYTGVRVFADVPGPSGEVS
jgi:hypothetical protein